MQDRWRLSHARGYLALDLIEEAAAELAALPAPGPDTLDVLAVRGLVLPAQQRLPAQRGLV